MYNSDEEKLAFRGILWVTVCEILAFLFFVVINL